MEKRREWKLSRVATAVKWALGFVQVHPYEIDRMKETIRRQAEEIQALEFRIKTLER